MPTPSIVTSASNPTPKAGIVMGVFSSSLPVVFGKSESLVLIACAVGMRLTFGEMN
jgi:hypothetical protein